LIRKRGNNRKMEEKREKWKERMNGRSKYGIEGEIERRMQEEKNK
jgi:hypothetical protein